MIFLTSTNGVDISLDANFLTKNGNPVTGLVDLEYVEVFAKGDNANHQQNYHGNKF